MATVVGKTFSQISGTPNPPGPSDSVVGVIGGTTDALITVARLAVSFGSQVNDGTATGGTVTIHAAAGYSHKLTVGGVFTLAFADWAPAGNLSSVEVQLINGGAFGFTFPTVNWYLGDGTVSSLFSDMGITLQSIGTNVLLVWTTDGGTTLYGRAL